MQEVCCLLYTLGMVTQTISCYHCGSLDLIHYGKAPNVKQKFRCKTCGLCSREDPGSNAYDAAFQARVLAAYHERCSLRSVCRIFGISRQTLMTWLKKSRNAAAGNDPSSCTS
jgi:transposase-like protein